MKYREVITGISRTVVIAAIALSAVLALPIELAAQQHHHYKLIDIGTLGGPQSYFSDFYQGPFQLLNNSGTFVSWGDTSESDPYGAPLCFNPDCNVSHAFQWHHAITDLATLPGGASSAANWVSVNGLVAGASQNGQLDPLDSGYPEDRAVLWKDRQIIDLGTLPVSKEDPEGGYDSVAHSVNSSGQVVGWAFNTVPDPNSLAWVSSFSDFYEPFNQVQMRAFLWENGAMKDLGDLGGGDAWAMVINEAGQVTGISYTNSTPNQVVTRCTYTYPTLTPMPTQDPFLWESGKMIDLGGLGGTCGWPRAMNNHGQVVGASDLSGDLAMHPFLWTKGMGMQDLTTGTPLSGGIWGMATGINELGDVVGWVNTAANTQADAFFWNGTMIDLGNIDGCAHAWSINAKRQVVGHWGKYVGGSFPYVGDGDCVEGSFLSENGGPMVDLATLLPSNSGITVGAGAYEINDRGEIAGAGTDASGNSHTILLIPCDDNHPDIEDCDYSLAEINSTTRTGSAPISQNSQTTNQNHLFDRSSGDPLSSRLTRRLVP